MHHAICELSCFASTKSRATVTSSAQPCVEAGAREQRIRTQLRSRGLIFEIQMGMVDRGADLSWLSQYPHEKEICFPPLTGLEVCQS